jgi:hypothetical protein
MLQQERKLKDIEQNAAMALCTIYEHMGELFKTRGFGKFLPLNWAIAMKAHLV